MPRRGEAVTLESIVFTVMFARGGAVRWFKATRASDAAAPAAGDGG